MTCDGHLLQGESKGGHLAASLAVLGNIGDFVTPPIGRKPTSIMSMEVERNPCKKDKFTN